MTLDSQTHCAVTNRLQKARAGWDIIKTSLPWIRNKIGLFQAAIGSILKYGMATLRTTGNMDRTLRQFYSRCLRKIIYPTGGIGERQETNDYIRRKFRMPALY